MHKYTNTSSKRKEKKFFCNSFKLILFSVGFVALAYDVFKIFCKKKHAKKKQTSEEIKHVSYVDIPSFKSCAKKKQTSEEKIIFCNIKIAQ